MKKMIFSAVALVAFSFAGMANEIEEERVIINNSDTCCIVHDLAYDLAISEGADSETAGKAANIAYENCLKTSDKKSVSLD